MPIRRIAALSLAFVVLIASGCGQSEESDGTATSKTAPPEPTVVTFENVNEDGEKFRRKRLEVTGVASEPGAEIDAGEGRTTTADSKGEFSLRVRLKEIGENAIDLIASKPGFESSTRTIYITRGRTAAERAALRERERLRREREEAELRASAQAIDPKQFQKNPDEFAGEKVVISGEIFQIQEGDLDENFLLMNTECETEFEVRICDGPTVHVTYEGSTDKTEEDLVTVYGTVTGGYEYETQIGGANYVGSIEAEILE
jgi:hypothetical protein